MVGNHFCDSVDISRKDLLCNLAIPTTRKFTKNEPVTLRIIQAVAATPKGFGLVTSITPAGENSVTIIDENGDAVEAKVNWGFVFG